MRSLLAIALLSLTGCGYTCDDNAAAEYDLATGRPINCRAIVQANIDGWKSGQYSANDALASLERNCGADGHSWGR